MRVKIAYTILVVMVLIGCEREKKVPTEEEILTQERGSVEEETRVNYGCDGTGTIEYSDGSLYRGECTNNQKEGHGIMLYSWGDKYDGSWSKDKKEGQGEYSNQYGAYRGIWRDGKLIEVTNQNSYEEVYAYFNKIRQQAGMIVLEPNGILEESAQSHSNYIMIHNDELIGLYYHREEEGKEGFTGVTSRDRAIYQGYASRSIGEGISHMNRAEMSINSLMTAIYHRFGILTFTQNEVGVGFTQDPESMVRNFVHNTGNSVLNSLCQTNSYSSGAYYYSVCADENHKIETTLFLNATKDIEKQNPKYVLWPAKDSIDNLYEFEEEIPDPLPNYSKTGNPISIQFNRYFYPDSITMKSFKLFKDNNEVTNTKSLTEASDPNHRFSNYQFALFPLDVLEKNREYSVEFTYLYGGVEKRVLWSFRTKK